MVAIDRKGRLPICQKYNEINMRKGSMPGGMSGLQIRVGPRDGLRWVRLPLSSASFQPQGMMGHVEGIAALAPDDREERPCAGHVGD